MKNNMKIDETYVNAKQKEKFFFSHAGAKN